MSVYWITFRIHNDAGYETRYKQLIESVQRIMKQWWVEPTSFILFESEKNIDQIAAIVRASCDPSKDMALIGMPDYKSARVIGASQDPDLFVLMPFTKKA